MFLILFDFRNVSSEASNKKCIRQKRRKKKERQSVSLDLSPAVRDTRQYSNTHLTHSPGDRHTQTIEPTIANASASSGALEQQENNDSHGKSQSQSHSETSYQSQSHQSRGISNHRSHSGSQSHSSIHRTVEHPDTERSSPSHKDQTQKSSVSSERSSNHNPASTNISPEHRVKETYNRQHEDNTSTTSNRISSGETRSSRRSRVETVNTYEASGAASLSARPKTTKKVGNYFNI